MKLALRRFRWLSDEGDRGSDDISNLVATQTPKWRKWKKMYLGNTDLSLKIVLCIKRANKMLKKYTEHHYLSQLDLEKKNFGFSKQ